MQATATLAKNQLVQLLEELSEEQVSEVYTFALFIKYQLNGEADTSGNIEVKTLPVSSLQPLIGAVTWGGDAADYHEWSY